MALGSIASGAFSTAGGFILSFAGKIAGIPGALGGAASQGLSILSMMTSGIASVMGIALASIGPAAILGLVLAGLGLINQQFGQQINRLITTVTTKGPLIIQTLVNGITSQLPSLIASGADLVAKLAQGFATMFPVIVNAGIS